MSTAKKDQVSNEFLVSMGIDVEDLEYDGYDWRLVTEGWEIPSKLYSDQPYIVKTDDGAWLCAVTTGEGHEGEVGQHVVTMRSTDMGKTWSDPVEVEPPTGPEASYAVLLKVPSGRVYCFYDHNTDNVRQVIADKSAYPDGYCKRVDSLGYYVFKYSDDHGKSWSNKRYVIDIREMEIDRQNAYGGKIRFFWNVGKPFVHEGNAYLSVHKVGSFGAGFFTRSEGVLLKSTNLLTENDPEKIEFETLPDGDTGLRAPKGGGPIAEEQSYSVMSDGSFFCVYRTVDGYPVVSYSRDGGHNWTEPQYMTYTHNGRKVKNPRAANFAWKCSNGKYLYWFHNHGGRDYNDRNPVWICSGTEKQTPEGLIIEWSQPEILIYADDTYVRMSYPDLVEENGDFFVTETQKHTARLHKIERTFIDKIFSYEEVNTTALGGVALDLASVGKNPSNINMPKLPKFVIRDLYSMVCSKKDLRTGVSIEVSVKLNTLRTGQNILDTRDEQGKGFFLSTGEDGAVYFSMFDGRTQSCITSEPGVLTMRHLSHIVVIIDSGPKVMYFMVDGRFCDGGDYRQFGWGRFSPEFRDINGSDILIAGADIDGQVKSIRIYDRAIMSVEAVGNYRASIINS